MTTNFDAVVFDWRGTLVTTLTESEWIEEALRRLGRDHDPAVVAETVRAIERAAGTPDRLAADDVDTGATLHRDTYYAVFRDAGLAADLADALYAVESDPGCNPFADDAEETLRAVAAAGCRIAILSDIHFDLRPVFAQAGLGEFVTEYVLSFEHGVQKPDPAIFRATLAVLGTEAGRTLMVGDRASHDGAAVAQGLPTLLVPPLMAASQRRLHPVRALVR